MKTTLVEKAILILLAVVLLPFLAVFIPLAIVVASVQAIINDEFFMD